MWEQCIPCAFESVEASGLASSVGEGGRESAFFTPPPPHMLTKHWGQQLSSAMVVQTSLHSHTGPILEKWPVTQAVSPCRLGQFTPPYEEYSMLVLNMSAQLMKVVSHLPEKWAKTSLAFHAYGSSTRSPAVSLQQTEEMPQHSTDTYKCFISIPLASRAHTVKFLQVDHLTLECDGGHNFSGFTVHHKYNTNGNIKLFKPSTASQ